MADQPLVRPRSLVIVALLTLGGFHPLGAQEPRTPSPTATNAAEPLPPLERRPYALRALLDVDPRTGLDAAGRARLIEAWGEMARRFVGDPWRLEIQDGGGPLAGANPDDLDAELLRPFSDGFEAVWFIRLEPGEPDGYRLSGRSFDPRTNAMSTTRSRTVPLAADAPRALLAHSLELFTPSALLTVTASGEPRLSLQGGSLTPADPLGRIVDKGTVFVPYRIFEKPDGSTRVVQPIAWTYLRVREWTPPVARCDIISSLRDPLSRRVVGRATLAAQVVKPADRPTPLRIEARAEPPLPAAGYRVTMREPDTELARIVGTTDRDGLIQIPPGLTTPGPILVRVVSAGVEPLAEFPVMPGEFEIVRTIRIDTRPEATALQVRLDALRDEVVDQVALRARLRAFLEARLQGEAWDEIAALLQEFRKLPSKETFANRLKTLRTEAEATQTETRAVVLTPTVQARLEETETLIANYLDDELFTNYDKALAAAQAPPPAAPAPRASTPARATLSAPATGAVAQPASPPATGQPAPAAPNPAAGVNPF